MTNSGHRADTIAMRPSATAHEGAAPHGMWWVAWRQHRAAILGAAVIMVALAGAIVLFRIHLVATFGDLGCSTTAQTACRGVDLSALESQWRLMHGVLIAAPIALGVFLGAPIFAHEFSHGTHVLALTQSVRRIRWWATKLTVVVAPLLAGLIGLGFLTQWMDHSNWMTHRGGLAEGTFQVQSIVPAAFGLLAFSIAATAGIVLRSVIGSLVAALFVASAIVLVIAFPLRPHLVPTERQIVPLADTSAPIRSGGATETAVGAYGPGTLFLGSGFVTASGAEIGFNGVFCELPQVRPGSVSDNEWVAEQNKALEKCWKDQGIVGRYMHYVPASMLWPLRGVVAAICVILAALALALGAWRLPKSVAKR